MSKWHRRFGTADFKVAILELTDNEKAAIDFQLKDPYAYATIQKSGGQFGVHPVSIDVKLNGLMIEFIACNFEAAQICQNYQITFQDLLDAILGGIQ